MAASPMGSRRGPQDGIFLGIDFGTSGCRAVAIHAGGELLAQAETAFGADAAADPTQWWQALTRVLKDLLVAVDCEKVRALAVDGTSATLLLCDTQGRPLTPALLYNDPRALAQAARIAAQAPQQAAVHGPTSSLAKLLWFQDNGLAGQAAHALHQADWIAGRLTGAYGHSDYHNCLKLGYDAERLAWPMWLADLGVNAALLPQVHAPGEPLGPLHPDAATLLGLPPETQVRAGTTDGVAAFLAAGAHAPGHGVTSLGSTLVLKLVSDRPVFSPTHGVYSHRLGDRWLTGGASNSGGAVLAQYFSAEELRALTPLLKPDVPTGLDYYPLPGTGERFPVNDPALVPRLSPQPADRAVFLQGLLEGIARIEARGYELLAELGAPRLTALWTSGGGAQNLAWERLRARRLKVPLHKAHSELAAYGSARLAAGLHEHP